MFLVVSNLTNEYVFVLTWVIYTHAGDIIYIDINNTNRLQISSQLTGTLSILFATSLPPAEHLVEGASWSEYSVELGARCETLGHEHSGGLGLEDKMENSIDNDNHNSCSVD